MGSLEPTVATWDTDDGTKPNKRRGRKQNDSLPPSRSRDAQRAFRARRAEKLAWLEARIVDLEMENADFRRRLGLPAAQRPTPPHAASPLLSPMPRDGARPEEKVFKLDRGDSSRPHVSPPPRASTSAWMPSPAPIYLARSLPQPIMRHSAPRSNPSGGSPSVIDSGEMSDDEEHSRLLEFCGAMVSEEHLNVAAGPQALPHRSLPHDHLTCRVAWSILSPFTFSSSSASNSSTSTTAPPPTPGQLGAAIRQLSGNGTAPGGFIRIEPDRVLVAITAIEHLVGTCRALHHPLSGGPEGAVSIRCADQQFSPPQGYAAASSFAGSCDAFGVATMPSMEMVEAVELQDEDSYEAEEGGDLAGYGFLATLGQYGDQ